MDNHRATLGRSARFFLCATIALAGLASCASDPHQIAVGMSREEVLSRFGTPALDEPDRGGERLVFATAPMGQFAFGVDLAGDGTVERVEQVLTLEGFGQIQVGSWSEQDILWHFGPPAIRHTLNDHLVWDYRYRESGVYNSLFSVTFDHEGLVAATQNGPDWSFDNGGNNGHGHGHH